MVGVNRILQFQVYGSAVFGLLPVLPFLAGWVQLMLLLAFCGGVIGDFRQRFLLKSGLATVLSFGFFAMFLFQVSRTNLVEPLIQMLCMLLAVRLATEKKPRNVLQLFLLSTIILAASSMLSLDMAYLAYLVLLVLLVTSGLVLLTFFTADERISFDRNEWRLLTKVIAVLPVGSLLLMLVLFAILPRAQTPLWNFLNPKAKPSIGMSDEVRPGAFAELSASGQAAFRAESERLSVWDLYWRGIVLNRLEGRIWKRSLKIPEELLVRGAQQVVSLRFFSEPKADRYLVTLDQPHKLLEVRHEFSADGVASGRYSTGRKLNYRLFAQLDAQRSLRGDIGPYLLLPDDLSPRLKSVGEQIRRKGKNAVEKIALLENFFLQQQLSYSNRQLPTTQRPIDTFLFETKRGYCEYFASSFATILRLSRVPARLVGGYFGGEYNEVGGYYLVGEDLAHVWVEALDDDGLWRRIDPSRLAINADQALLQARRRELPTLQVIGDAMLHSWNRLVISYDLQQQFSLIRQVGNRLRNLKSLDIHSLKSILWLLLLPLIIGGFYLRRWRVDIAARLLTSYLRQVASCCKNSELPVNLGLYQLAQLSGEILCYRFAHIYGRAIYRDQPLTKEEIGQLKQIIHGLRGKQLAIAIAKSNAVEDNAVDKLITN